VLRCSKGLSRQMPRSFERTWLNSPCNGRALPAPPLV
jgi:hypothetical protein